MTHVYAAYCLHAINIKEKFLQVFYQVVTITQCPVMKVYTCTLSHSAACYSKVIAAVSTLNFAATQHAVNMK